MQKHINQAEHNLNLLSHLQENFPDSYFDWKVTLSFYVAIHLLKALAEHRGKPLGQSHEEIARSLGHRANPKLFPIPPKQWNNYFNLYQYSRSSRYDGFEDLEDHEEVQKGAYEHCAVLLQYFIKYIQEQLGIKIPQTTDATQE